MYDIFLGVIHCDDDHGLFCRINMFLFKSHYTMNVVPVLRKAVLSDFMTIPLKNDNTIRPDKIKNNKIQGDYGEKKFIKP